MDRHPKSTCPKVDKVDAGREEREREAKWPDLFGYVPRSDCEADKAKRYEAAIGVSFGGCES